ncbi:MAG: hypothetical protein EHM21_14140 [Chloroflexi bacterium]|nr:MAG: hypothetical protein EHM21_14140 [Chloroflexota bacterium]
MYTDLFLALLNRENPRGHPLLSALLYSFCPAAARWWLKGADPVLPFDPIWQAVKDHNSEDTLGMKLQYYGLGDVADLVGQYIKGVDAYRFHHSAVQAPELLPFFRGGQFPLNRRFGSENGIRNLGGKWENLFLYARTWAFLVDDWRAGMRIPSDANFSLKIEPVKLTLAEYRLPVHFDALVWRMQVGHVTEVRLGLLVQRGKQDLLRFALLSLSSTDGDQPWPNLPLVYALDRETGEAKLADLPISRENLPELVRQLSDAAKGGPYPPLNALQQLSVCKDCGYAWLCYHKSNFSPHLLSEE